MTISRAAGFPVGGGDSSSGGVTSVTVSPAAIGDLVVVSVFIGSTSITVSGVSGGHATGWARAEGFTDSTSTLRAEIWIGTATATGSAAASVTFSASIATTYVEIDADSLHSSIGGPWSVVASGGQHDVTGTSNPFPPLTATVTGQAYWGIDSPVNTPSAGSDSGFVYNLLDSSFVCTALNVAVTAGTVAPSAGQSPTGTATTVAIIVTDAFSAAGGPSMPFMPAPGWHPGLGLPGMPGGTPFYAPQALSSPPAAPTVTVTLPAAAVTLAAPIVAPAAGATIALPVATAALAAPVPSVTAGATVALPVAAIALAAPVVTPATAVLLPTATVALAAPAATPAAGARVALPAAAMALAAPVVTPSGGPAPFDSLPSTTFPATPLGGRVELLLGGVWTDVTSYLVQPLDSVVPITRGHPDESTTTAPSGVPLTLFNGDGRFSGKNPTGPYYGQLARNTPLRFSIPEGASYLRSEVDQASYVQCPDTAGISITGDMEFQLDLTLDNWNSSQILAAKWASGQASWLLLLWNDGTLQFQWSQDGSSINAARTSVSVPLPPSRRMSLRVTLAVATGTVTYYTGPPGLSSPSWTQLGSPIVLGANNVFNSTAPLQIGYGPSSGTGFFGYYGKLHAAQLLSGIGGTAKASPDFTAQTPGTTSFSDAQSNTWTLEGTAEISGRDYRIHAEASAWPQFWDPTGHDVTVQLTAAGPLRRLGQNANRQVFASAMRRAYQRLTGPTAPVAYWPAEDGANSTQIASGLGGPAMQVSVPPQFGGNSGFLCSSPIPALAAGSTWSGAVPAYTGGVDNVLRFLMQVPAAGDVNGGIIARMYTRGTITRADLVYGTGGGLTMNVYQGSTLLSSFGPFSFSVNGELLRVSLELQASGGNVSCNIVTLQVGAFSGIGDGGTQTGATVGNVTQVVINPGGLLTGTAIGQISVQPVWETLYDLGSALNAWQGEAAGARFKRLCDEEAIVFRGQGNLAASTPMGPQTPEALTTLWQECADADRGAIYEPRQQLALGYRTRASMLNQGAAAAIPYSMLMAPLLPTEDDQIIANDVTCTQNQDGSFSEQAQATGPLNIQSPSQDPDGVGRYAVSVPVNLAADSQLDGEASWIRHMGTVDEPRYPALCVDLASTESGVASIFSALLGLDIGDRVTVTGTPPWLPPDGIDLLIQGVTENIWLKKLNLSLACVPSSPWNVMTWNDPVWGRWASDGSALAAGVSSSATSLSVSTTNPGSPLWTTSAGDLPFDILVAGERMTVTAISGASSPQAFTVVRSVNSVVKAQTAGAPLTLFYPPIWSL